MQNNADGLCISDILIKNRERKSGVLWEHCFFIVLKRKN